MDAGKGTVDEKNAGRGLWIKECRKGMWIKGMQEGECG